MKICFITVTCPYGQAEAFLIKEFLEIKHQGINLLIIPRNPAKKVFHQEAKPLLENTVWLPLINFKIMIIFLKSLFNIRIWRILGQLIKYSGNLSIFFKNLIVLPKGIFIANLLKKEKIDHLHAHWGATTATMAYMVSYLTGLSWSFTLHRWDIKENNMLEEKVRAAKFVRCISEHGKNELLQIINGKYEEKVKAIHLGVEVLDDFQPLKNKNFFTIVTPANLLEVKGHRYLIEACSILVQRGIKNFQCIFYGEGPLRIELENLIQEKKLTDYIKIPGAIAHEKLIAMYKNQEADLVVLPSITTKDGEHEGIPVSPMEAMAYGIPVISTNTGGIPELLSRGAGIIVQEKSPQQIAEAILSIGRDESLAQKIASNGYQRVKEYFDLKKIWVEVLTEIQKFAIIK